MTSADIDASRMDADLHLCLDLTKLLGELKVERSVKIGDQDALMISAQRPGQPAFEMYFDTQTGLLVRLVRYAQSPLGRNPAQIDYSDLSGYRRCENSVSMDISHSHRTIFDPS
jgi:photosynthetic reaction center cytochrome c subunit